MNDYKELIAHVQGDAAFRHIISECGADGRVWFDKRFICDYVSHLKYAIEQLVKERDAAVADLRNAIADDFSLSQCHYCKYQEEDGQCYHDCIMFSPEWGWEWRGVKDEVSE